jgi:hypothetical protein
MRIIEMICYNYNYITNVLLKDNSELERYLESESKSLNTIKYYYEDLSFLQSEREKEERREKSIIITISN